MNLIEALFGVAPDGGSGFLEAAILAAAVILIAVLWRLVRRGSA